MKEILVILFISVLSVFLINYALLLHKKSQALKNALYAEKVFGEWLKKTQTPYVCTDPEGKKLLSSCIEAFDLYLEIGSGYFMAEKREIWILFYNLKPQHT